MIGLALRVIEYDITWTTILLVTLRQGASSTEVADSDHLAMEAAYV